MGHGEVLDHQLQVPDCGWRTVSISVPTCPVRGSPGPRPCVPRTDAQRTTAARRPSPGNPPENPVPECALNYGMPRTACSIGKWPRAFTARRSRALIDSMAAIADRVVQAALKLVLEPIFEADSEPVSYGFRPRRRARVRLRMLT